MAISGQHDVFAARLARINQTSGTPAVLLAGVEDVPTQRRTMRTAKRNSLISLKAILGLPFAFLVGAVSMVAGHAAAYRFFEEMVRAADALGLTTMVAADIVLAAVISLIVLMLFGYARKSYVLSAAVGFVAILTNEIELARNFPEIWSQIYSPHFVESSLRAGKLLLPDIATSFSLI